jgi:hypothetical protein
MKRYIVVSCVLVLVCVGVSASGSADRGAPSDQEVLGELMALETEALNPYYGESDPTRYVEQFTSDATYFDPWSGGRLEGAEIGEHLMGFKGVIPLNEYELVDPRVNVFGEIAIFTVVCESTNMETGVTTPWNVTLIYRRSEGGWEKIHANWNYRASQPAQPTG